MGTGVTLWQVDWFGECDCALLSRNQTFCSALMPCAVMATAAAEQFMLMKAFTALTGSGQSRPQWGVLDTEDVIV